MKKFARNIFPLTLCMLILFAFVASVSAYSGWLDDYNGSCSSEGLATLHTWNNDDGCFYAEHYITSSAGWDGYMQVTAQKHFWYGWISQLIRTITKDNGYYALDFPVANGTYRLWFNCFNNRLLVINFNGNVWDEN